MVSRHMAYTTVAAYATVAAVSATVGYLLGRESNAQVHNSLAPVPPPAEPTPDQNPEPPVKDEEESSDDEVDGDLGAVQAGMFEECKLVLVVRTDLGMTKGKIAAQCGHATLACYKTLEKSNPTLLRHWERTGQAKVALRVDSEEELMLLQATAQSLNICARAIRDAGRTQIAAGSQTVLGVGPAPVHLVNQVTGKLKLL